MTGTSTETERDRAIRHCQKIRENGGRPGVICHPDMKPGVVLMLPGLPIRTSMYLEKDAAYTIDFSLICPTKEEMDQQYRDWFRQSMCKASMWVNVKF